jgi:hypothetical protein
MLASGDMMMVSAVDGARLAVVAAVNDGAVRLAPPA